MPAKFSSGGTNPFASPAEIGSRSLNSDIDKFSYEAEFDLQDPQAEFREVFRFADKSIRRQRHTMNMRDINEIVQFAQTAGWNYNGFIDLITAGFEYAYVLMFTHP